MRALPADPKSFITSPNFTLFSFALPITGDKEGSVLAPAPTPVLGISEETRLLSCVTAKCHTFQRDRKAQYPCPSCLEPYPPRICLCIYFVLTQSPFTPPPRDHPHTGRRQAEIMTVTCIQHFQGRAAFSYLIAHQIKWGQHHWLHFPRQGS